MQERHPGTRQFGAHRAAVGREAEIDFVAIGPGGSRDMSAALGTASPSGVDRP
jgi:hypothetical protein